NFNNFNGIEITDVRNFYFLLGLLRRSSAILWRRVGSSLCRRLFIGIGRCVVVTLLCRFVGFQQSDDVAFTDAVAFAYFDFDNGPGHGGGYFQRGLVGFKRNQWLF